MTKTISLTIVLVAIVISLMLGGTVLAQTGTSDKNTVLGGLNTTANKADVSQFETKDSTAGLTNFVGIVINSLFGVVAIIFLTVTMIGGFLWMTAAGAEDKIGKAKKFITNGLLGMTAIFLSYSLVFLVLSYLNSATTNAK